MKNIEVPLILSPGPGNPGNRRSAFFDMPDGRLMLMYSHFYGEYNAANDHSPAYVAARISRDDGQTWTEDDHILLANEGGRNTVSTSMLDMRDNTTALFYARKESLADCRPVVRRAADPLSSWGKPVEIITDKVAYYVVNNDRVVRLDSGRILVPVAQHGEPGTEFVQRGRAVCYLSDDDGQTWRRGATTLEQHLLPSDPSGLQEPGVIELHDGRVMMFCRGGGGRHYLSWSQDGGDTWCPVEASSFDSPCSPASIKRMPTTGDLLMVWNNNGADNTRTPLTIATSPDDGKTWRGVQNVEDSRNSHYCYVAIHFRDGHVLLGYSAGQRDGTRLNETRIVRFPVDSLYT